jgi:hypothetical protein
MRGLILCIALLGCAGPTDEPAPGTDAGAPLGLTVEVGTGPRGTAQAVAAGEGLLLQRGCQGAQHIFTSVRIYQPARGAANVRVRVVRDSDGLEVSVPLDVTLPLEEDPQRLPGFGAITGLTPVIEVPKEVLGKEVSVHVSVTDAAGALGAGKMTGTVSWGPDSCG